MLSKLSTQKEKKASSARLTSSGAQRDSTAGETVATTNHRYQKEKRGHTNDLHTTPTTLTVLPQSTIQPATPTSHSINSYSTNHASREHRSHCNHKISYRSYVHSRPAAYHEKEGIGCAIKRRNKQTHTQPNPNRKRINNQSTTLKELLPKRN